MDTFPTSDFMLHHVRKDAKSQTRVNTKLPVKGQIKGKKRTMMGLYKTLLNLYKSEEATGIHKIMKSYLILAQCFGLMPVRGICSSDSSKLSFAWNGKRVIYSVTTLVIGSYMCYHYIFLIIIKGFSPDLARRIFFFIFPVLLNISCLSLARNWPNFIHKWEKVERKLYTLSIKTCTSFKLKMYIFCSSIFYVYNFLYFFYIAITSVNTCEGLDKDWNLMHAMFLIYFIKLDISLPGIRLYTLVLAFYCIVTPIVLGLTEGLILPLIYSMTSYFKQFNEQMECVKFKKMTPYYWRNMREVYNELAYLTKTMDTNLCVTIFLLISFYFGAMCLSIYLHLKSHQTLIFLFIVSCTTIKTVIFIIFVSSVNNESKKAMTVLYSVSSDTYCIEIKRFLKQIHYENIVLSGSHLFNINRGFFVTIVQAIVTYVLVAFQIGPNYITFKITTVNQTLICNYLIDVFNNTNSVFVQEGSKDLSSLLKGAKQSNAESGGG